MSFWTDSRPVGDPVVANIFISYAREDRETASSLAVALAARGWSVFWDHEIPTGKSFDRVIEQELAAAKCVIVLWSRHASDSDWVRSEAREGARREILHPVLIEEAALPLEFSHLQTANLTDWHPGVPHDECDRLFDDLGLVLTGRQPPAPATDIRTPGSRSRRSRIVRRRWLEAAALVGVLGIALALFLTPTLQLEWLWKDTPPPPSKGTDVVLTPEPKAPPPAPQMPKGRRGSIGSPDKPTLNPTPSGPPSVVAPGDGSLPSKEGQIVPGPPPKEALTPPEGPTTPPEVNNKKPDDPSGPETKSEPKNVVLPIQKAGPEPPKPVPNEASVREAVAAYAAALTSGAREAVKRVFPDVSELELREIESVRGNFRDRYTMTIIITDVDITGTRAAVRGRVFHNGIDDSGKPFQKGRDERLNFRWTGDTWVRVR